ncbi:MAG: ATP-binding cassette domain-containing protein [Proteobacteria bacterium]|jgi:branched-chain amino acid transport system ATP-binding protein|nr:ATP-binding cassette domain-containing protein [Pseudomonadota bacterium]MDA1135190.1 ATP-binding cassette domain-containing protein [Pseudomonadota bacterium]|tara:strand:+ start:107 stop:748 length:642 start_codon:yes stop_codon:yes gene_type:complete
MLFIDKVSVKIAAILALKNFSLEIKKGEIVALIGRNGAGKTTLLKSIMGVNKLNTGYIKFLDEDLSGTPNYYRASLGIGYMPEDRALIPELTVEENILLPSWALKNLNGVERLATVYKIMPELKEMSDRKALLLSGGQQKMAALGRALMSGTQLLLLDEPFEGVAPALSQRLGDVIRDLKKQNLSIILSQSELNHTEDIFDKEYIIERGENVN